MDQHFFSSSQFLKKKSQKSDVSDLNHIFLPISYIPVSSAFFLQNISFVFPAIFLTFVVFHRLPPFIPSFCQICSGVCFLKNSLFPFVHLLSLLPLSLLPQTVGLLHLVDTVATCGWLCPLYLLSSHCPFLSILLSAPKEGPFQIQSGLFNLPLFTL